MKIKYVSSKVLKDYAGMNYLAARVMGFPMKDGDIFIDKNLSKKLKLRTIKHEVAEIKYMKKGYPYWKAHKLALIDEKRFV